MIKQFLNKFKKQQNLTSKTKIIGDFGESEAAKFLKRNKYKILCKNYIANGKEIDIIAENKDFLIFCEVKTRITDNQTIEKYGRPRDAVNREKQLHIVSAARAFLAKNKSEKRIRFDVIEVYLEKSDGNPIREIKHLQDAFRA